MKNNWKEERLIYSKTVNWILQIIMMVIAAWPLMIPLEIPIHEPPPNQDQATPLGIIAIIWMILTWFPVVMHIFAECTWQMTLCSWGLWPEPKKLRVSDSPIFDSGNTFSGMM